MSEAIKIKEGGIDKSQNQIFKLKTNLSGGGACYWLPETQLLTERKRINANGTYVAEQEGYYGYNEITVSIPNSGKMTGKGSDGNSYAVDVDENGYIVETKIPSSMSITTEPTKLIYFDGDTIDYTGMVVKLYDGEGNLFTDDRYTDSVIPASELSLIVTQAQYSGGGGSESGKVIDDTTGLSQGDIDSMPVDYCLGHEFVWSDGRYSSGADDGYPYVESYSGADPIYAIAYGYANPTAHWAPLLCSKSRFTANVVKHNSYGVYRDSVRVVSSVINGKDVYYTQVSASELADAYEGNIRRTPLVESYAQNLAYIVLYGYDWQGGSSEQTIPVEWISPYSAETFTDSFDITVHGQSGETT